MIFTPYEYRNYLIRFNNTKDDEGFTRYGYDIFINQWVKAIWDAVDQETADKEMEEYINKLENKSVEQIECAARQAELEKLAREIADLNISNPTDGDYLFILNCVLAGASVAVGGLEKFKEKIEKKAQN